MPLSIAIAGLVVLAVLWVVVTDRLYGRRGEPGPLPPTEPLAECIADVAARRAERETARGLYPTTGRSVLGTPRDWSASA